MSLADTIKKEKEKSGEDGDGPACYVLIGGEAWKWQGVEPLKRHVFHTSASYVCRAYDQLRDLGVPHSSIITIVQLRDYLDGLTSASESEGIDSRLKMGYTYAHKSTLSVASRLLAEGGPTYDGKDVNPFTIWSVLRGEASERTPVVVPPNSRFIFFGIYSHGLCHSVFPPPPKLKGVKVEVDIKVKEGNNVEIGISLIKPPPKKEGEQGIKTEGGPNGEDVSVGGASQSPYHQAGEPVSHERMDPLTHEWYAFLPYGPDPPAPHLLDFVCTVGAPEEERPETLFYASQLKAILCHLFLKRPNRPVLGLLNYCLSGGFLDFMTRKGPLKHYGANEWPLWLMSSSGASHNSLVGGLWQSFFDNLPLLQQSDEKTCVFEEYYRRVVFHYHKNNAYELLNLIKSQAYPQFEVEECPENTYHKDLMAILCTGPYGEPDFEALKTLQEKYHSGEKFGRPIYICVPKSEKKVDLVEVVKECLSKIAAPEEVHGKTMGELDFSLFFPNAEEQALASSAPVATPPHSHHLSSHCLSPTNERRTRTNSKK